MSAGAEFFAVDVDASDLLRICEAMAKRSADMTQIMAVVAEDLVAAVSDEFDSEGHGDWPPLAPSTVGGRRHGPHGKKSPKILQDTGRWAGSNQADHGSDFAEATTDVGYAIFHVSAAPRAKIPLRNPYDLPDEVHDAAAAYILEALDL